MENNESDAKAVEYMRDMYKGCMDEGKHLNIFAHTLRQKFYVQYSNLYVSTCHLMCFAFFQMPSIVQDIVGS